MPIFNVHNLEKSFAGKLLFESLNFGLDENDRVGLVGPNGAGKTTFINLLTGSLAPTSGRVFFGEQDITRLAQHERVKRGMTRTFQINTLFAGLTVVESVVMAICEREGRQFRWTSGEPVTFLKSVWGPS